LQKVLHVFLKTCVFRIPAPDVAEHRDKATPLHCGADSLKKNRE
jgi:hypothetical protein